MKRLTFSRSLADHILDIHPDGNRLRIRRVQFVVSRALRPGEASRSGLYAIASARTGRVLRISLFQAIADEFRDESREIFECWLADESVAECVGELGEEVSARQPALLAA